MLIVFLQIILCLIPILGIMISNKNEKIAGVLYIISGLILCISIGLLGLIPLALLGKAANMNLRKKE